MPIPGLAFTDAEIFPAINLVLPAWVLLMLVPKAKLTQAVVNLVTLFMCLLYVLLIYTAITAAGTDFNFDDMFTMEGVANLLSKSSNALPCWIHYAAFDLWTGRWIAMDAASRHIPRLLLVPILGATLMLGPAGLLTYMLIRGNWRMKSKVE